jgi:hypothetical protein
MNITRALRRIRKELPSINKPTLKIMWSNIVTTNVYCDKRCKCQDVKPMVDNDRIKTREE